MCLCFFNPVIRFQKHTVHYITDPVVKDVLTPSPTEGGPKNVHKFAYHNPIICIFGCFMHIFGSLMLTASRRTQKHLCLYSGYNWLVLVRRKLQVIFEQCSDCNNSLWSQTLSTIEWHLQFVHSNLPLSKVDVCLS